MTFQCFEQETQAAGNAGFIKGNYTENVNITLCMPVMKALLTLHECTGLSEPMATHMISSKISCSGSVI